MARTTKLIVVGCITALSVLLTGELAHGQHADVELGYNDIVNPSQLLVESVEFTAENIPVFESEMEPLDPFNPSDLGADDPGFATNASDNLQLNPGDQLWIEAIDASNNSNAGLGFVNFYNPVTDQLEIAGRIAVLDNSSGTTDLILNGSDIESGMEFQFIDTGDSGGDIHDHVIFDLLDEGAAATGAYGVMFRMHTDVAPVDGMMDVESETFWIIFNNGMSSTDFENLALPRFGEAITVVEPASFQVVHGDFVAGTVSDLAASDNLDVQARRRSNDIQARVTISAEATSPLATPASMTITVEAAVFARSTIVQIIELFNYDSSSWEEVDLRNATRIVDSVATVTVSGDPSRFVQPGTNTIEARVRYTSAVQRQLFSANVDRISWDIQN